MATKQRSPRQPAVKPGTSSSSPKSVRFFRMQVLWRAWLAKHHGSSRQQWVGFWRVVTGKPSITWPQSVDEALCFGWIDGLRRGLDAESYAIRFTPRSATTLWSRVNLKRFMELEQAGVVRAAGRAARARWDDKRASGYSHDTPNSVLDETRLAALRARPKAWRFWEAQTPSYRKVAGHWVVSAKQEATRARRFAALVACCEAGKAIPPLGKWAKVKPASPLSGDAESGGV